MDRKVNIHQVVWQDSSADCLCWRSEWPLLWAQQQWGYCGDLPAGGHRQGPGLQSHATHRVSQLYWGIQLQGKGYSCSSWFGFHKMQAAMCHDWWLVHVIKSLNMDTSQWHCVNIAVMPFTEIPHNHDPLHASEAGVGGGWGPAGPG